MLIRLFKLFCFFCVLNIVSLSDSYIYNWLSNHDDTLPDIKNSSTKSLKGSYQEDKIIMDLNALILDLRHYLYLLSNHENNIECLLCELKKTLLKGYRYLDNIDSIQQFRSYLDENSILTLTKLTADELYKLQSICCNMIELLTIKRDSLKWNLSTVKNSNSIVDNVSEISFGSCSNSLTQKKCNQSSEKVINSLKNNHNALCTLIGLDVYQGLILGIGFINKKNFHSLLGFCKVKCFDLIELSFQFISLKETYFCFNINIFDYCSLIFFIKNFTNIGFGLSVSYDFSVAYVDIELLSTYSK